MKLNFELIRRILRLLYHFVFCLMLEEFFMLIFKRGDIKIYQMAVIFAAFIISYLIREFVTKNFFVFLLHIFIGVGVYFIPGDTYVRWFSVIIVIGLFIASNNYIAHKLQLLSLNEVPWPTFLAAFCMYILGLYSKNDKIITLSYIVPIILFGIFLIMLYVDGLNGYVKRTKDISGLPLRKILKTNSVIVFGILIILSTVVLLANYINLDATLVAFGNGLVKLVKLIIMIFAVIFAIISKLIRGRGVGDLAEETQEIKQAAQETNAFFTGLEVLLKVGFIIVVVFVLYKILQKIMKYFFSKRINENDIVEKIIPGDKTDFKDKKSLVDILRERMSNTEKARRIYKNKVKSFKEYYQPDNVSTAKDIEEGIMLSSDKDIKKLTECYENIRYNNVVVDKKTLSYIKKL